jgi:hypothetical protein
MAFLYQDTSGLKLRDTDQDPKKMEKLITFRAELEAKRIVKYWIAEAELVNQVKDSVNSIVRRKPAVGWIRGDQALDPAVYKELELLRKENEQLKHKLAEAISEIGFPEDISQGDDSVTIEFDLWEHKVVNREMIKTRIIENNVDTTWRKLLDVLGDDLYKGLSESSVHVTVADYVLCESNPSIGDRNGRNFVVTFKQNFIKQMRCQFVTLGLITCSYVRSAGGLSYLAWELTENGKKYISKLHAIRRGAADPANEGALP